MIMKINKMKLRKKMQNKNLMNKKKKITLTNKKYLSKDL